MSNLKFLNTLKKLIQKVLRQIVPPIFDYAKFKEIINFLLREKNQIYLEESFFKRHAFINKAISKYTNCNYLEIGVENNDVFNSIPLKLKNKYGVDPVCGGNYRLTSDAFFEEYKHLKFDVIFIDGLHHYLQCQKDAINSINSLNKKGVIFFHDMLPQNSYEELVKLIRYQKWKLISPIVQIKINLNGKARRNKNTGIWNKEIKNIRNQKGEGGDKKKGKISKKIIKI